jgi:tetratricopeptide (TPR) repeat protein
MFANILHLLLAGQAAATPAPKLGLQQLFDRGSQLASEGKCAEALQDFAAVENRTRSKPNRLLTAALDVRKGGCLVTLGREEEGETALRRGLPVLAEQAAEFARDLRDGHLLLGGVRLRRFDYAGAAQEYRQALDRSTASDRLRPLVALANVLAFDHDGEALRYGGEARTIALADANLPKDAKAAVQTMYARVLLNQGQLKEAYSELKDVLRRQGGLTSRVGIDDIVTRSDLAIAAMLNRDQAGAREYLAYTGAGRMPETPFTTAASLQPPLCGATTGLKPEDFAIVEFSVGDDGSVAGVLPIYTTGNREVALAFARAVSEWSWKPEVVKSIPPLFRYTTRVELRCTRVGERPDLTDPLAERFRAWLSEAGQSDAAWSELPDARAAGLIRPAVEGARSAGNRPALVQALAALGTNRAIPDGERLAALDEAIRAAAEAKAPVAVHSYLVIERAFVDGANDRQDRAVFRSLLAEPAIAADPLTAATLRLLIAVPGYRQSRPDDAMPLLEGVVQTAGLPPQHPLKVNALLQQATVLADKGDLAGARQLFDRTGLDEGQCALIGLEPVMRRTSTSSRDYPMEAVRMGFEGWARMEFDIAADGRTIAPRVIAAYPPFVFNEAAAGFFRDARYQSSYRPSGGLACAAEQSSISFKLQQ